MRLISASGSPDMQEALSHPNVRTIVDIMLQVQSREYFRLITQFLKQNEHNSSLKFEQDLELLSNYYRRTPNSEGLVSSPLYVDMLKQTLVDLYRQHERKIRYQRGAILELLAYRLVCPRYQLGECLGNGRFIDERGRNITDQVDVAALSHRRFQVEGYECKMKAAGIASEDCTNLTALGAAAQERNYNSNVGFVSFDNDWKVNNRLKFFESPSSIKAYGLDSLDALRNTPF